MTLILCSHEVFFFCVALCRQKKKTGSKERIPSAKSRETQSQSSKSDSGNSGSGLEGSIATASAIDCIIEEEKLPKQARNNKERSFTDSSSSSSGYSEKGQTEVNVEKSKGKNAIELKQREMIKKQLSERKRSASEKSSNASVSKQKVAEKLVEDIEEKRPLPVVAKARTPRAEVQKLFLNCYGEGVFNNVTGVFFCWYV